MPLVSTTPFKTPGCEGTLDSNTFANCPADTAAYLPLTMDDDTPSAAKFFINNAKYLPLTMDDDTPVAAKFFINDAKYLPLTMDSDTGTQLNPSTSVDVVVSEPARLNAITQASLSGWDSVLTNKRRRYGKWYWEIYIDENEPVFETSRHRHGIAYSLNSDQYVGQNAQSYSYDSGWGPPNPLDGYYYTSGGTTGNFGDSWQTGNIISVAVDLDAGNLWFAKNGTWQGAGADPATGAFPAMNFTIGQYYYPAFSLYRNTVNDPAEHAEFTVNFGPTSGGTFTYTPPTGFGAW